VNRTPRIAFALLLAALPLGLACSGGPAAAPPPPPPEVTVVTLERTDVELPFEVPGRLQGSREVEVRARVKGILEAWTYSEGEPVREGQLLFRIDPSQYAAAVDLAKATVAEAEARLVRAERDAARLGPLAEREAVSRREYDDALSERDLARASLESARAALRSAELELGYTRVTAPVSGVSGRALKSQGSLVDDGENSLLTKISRLDPIWALFTLSDRDLARLEQELASTGKRIEDLEAELVLASGEAHPVRGKLNFAGSQIDPSTGSVELRAAFPNGDGSLLPGQFVSVRLRGVERAGAILVPQRAVLQSGSGRSVYVVDEAGKAEARPVVLDQWSGDQWLVESGLEAGERVVVDGALKVRPGSEVRVAVASEEESGS